MAWSDAIYTCHPDEETARAAATALGVDFPASGRIPTGNENYALHAPMVWPDGVSPPEAGFWSMLRINLEWGGAEATLAAIEAAGVQRALVDPPVVWA